MRRIRTHLFPRLVVLLLGVLVLGACNALGITGEDDNEARVTVRALGADHLDGSDNFRYQVTSGTQYEGLSNFADIAVGDVVEIEWEAVSGSTRRALEIEADGADDDDRR